MSPQIVKPDHILHELSELWTSLSKQEHEQEHKDGKTEGSGVLRACAMTLIAFVDDDADSSALSDTIGHIMRSHPSRAIIVRLHKTEGILDSRVFAQCWMPAGHHKQICCEQVELSVSLNRAADIPSIIAPLAAPDVPRVIWFRSSAIDRVPELGGIMALGDKMIVDTAHPGAPAFADLRVLSNAGYIVGDLTWTRLTKLRQLVAQLLDGSDLSAVQNVSIEYSGSEAPPEAKYLQAWLRSELGSELRSDRQSASVDLRPVDSAGAKQIKAIRIDTGIHVRLEENCAEYETGSMRQRANLPESPEGELLREELNIMSHDRIFERALQRMTAWTPRS
ncbi:MAG TPA: glucose-6-phosphate dehydrogenase assembly protein OpcA [Bryobacteraceae bacterium]